MSNTVPQTRIIPLADWPKYHPWPPIGGLRHIAFNLETSGFKRAILRVGGRVLIDEAAFFQCAREQASEAK